MPAAAPCVSHHPLPAAYIAEANHCPLAADEGPPTTPCCGNQQTDPIGSSKTHLGCVIGRIHVDDPMIEPLTPSCGLSVDTPVGPAVVVLTPSWAEAEARSRLDNLHYVHLERWGLEMCCCRPSAQQTTHHAHSDRNTGWLPRTEDGMLDVTHRHLLASLRCLTL